MSSPLPLPNRIAKLRELIAAGLTFGEVVPVFAEQNARKAGSAERAQAYLTAASEKHERDGEVEIDKDAVISESKDGAYVMGWLWIYDREAGLDNEEDE